MIGPKPLGQSLGSESRLVVVRRVALSSAAFARVSLYGITVTSNWALQRSYWVYGLRVLIRVIPGKIGLGLIVSRI